MQASKPNPTRWTLIVRAQGTGADARAALGELMSQYEGFVLWLVRRNRPPPDASTEDLKQEFLACMLRRNDVAKLDRSRGSFRAWLTVAVRRFVVGERQKWAALHAGRRDTSLTPCEAFHTDTPEDAVCAQAFAAHLLLHVLSLLRAEARDPQRFEALVRFLPGPQMDLVELGPIARSQGMTATALAKAICDLRARFRDLLRSAVRDTLDFGGPSPAGPASVTAHAVEQELRELRCLFYPRDHTGVIPVAV
jgi:DNA-directed RNA polymerase specialized sigma24 family protein